MYAHNVFACMHTQSIKYIHTKKLLYACTHINFLHTYIHTNHYTPRMYTKLLHASMYTTFLQAHTQIINRNTQHAYQKIIAHIHAHNIFARIHTQSIECIHTINYDTHTCTQQYCSHTHTALNPYLRIKKLLHTSMRTTFLHTHILTQIIKYIHTTHTHKIIVHMHVRKFFHTCMYENH